MRKQSKLKEQKKEESAVDVNSLCRLCLNHCDKSNSSNIFGTLESSLTLRIMACTGLEATQQDALPKQICFKCRLMLEKSFLFRNKCKNSDGKLRHHFRLVNAGKESNLFDSLEEEFEDDFSQSVALIDELENKLNQNHEANIESRIQEAVEKEKQRIYDEVKTTLKSQLKDSSNQKKNRNSVPDQSTHKRPATRSTTHQTQKKENMEEKHIIEVIMTGDDEQSVEYVLGDSEYNNIESFDGLAQNVFEGNNSNQDLFELEELTNADFKNALLNSKQEEFEDEEEELEEEEEEEEHEEIEIGDDEAEEYLDENGDENSSQDGVLLESLLPAIKKSVEQKSGTILDDEAQYKIVRTSGEEIRVQCISSDGKEFEIEMVMDQSYGQSLSYERDESGDFKIFSCSKCPKTFSRRGKLINHERDHTAKINGQECPHCQKWFPSNSTLTRHIRVHTGEKPFKCSICRRAFIQKEILKRHLMTHSGERPFKCTECPKSFILKEALRQHVNRNHTENPTPEMHQCPFCPKSFCHSSGLSRHLLIHAGRTFACDFCHKKFNDKSALKRHTTSIHKSSTSKRKKN